MRSDTIRPSGNRAACPEPVGNNAMPRTIPGVERDEDGILLAAVAEHRDRAAFAKLVDCHQQALFSLAQYLAPDRARAEEVVQDALLQAWSRADRFEYLGPGSVRAWLLRVTANEGIRAARSRDREARRIKRVEAQSSPLEAVTVEHSAERRELLDALRAKLNELSGADREMVALYYGAGLDQKSIAEHLQLTQQAVSYRLKRVLETLREGLLKGGFAAAVPLLDSADLGGALHGGAEVPSGFADRVAFLVARGSVRSMRAGAIVSAPYAVMGALLLLGVGGAVWWQAQYRVAVPVETEAPSAVPAAPIPATPPAAKLAEETVYEDEFSSPRLNDFWSPPQPANTKERVSVMTNGSKLLLLAGGRSVVVSELVEGTKNEYRLNSRVELISRFVDLDERPVEILFGATGMIKAESCYAFEGEVVDNRGRFIFKWKQTRTEHGGPLVLSNRVGDEEVAVPEGPFMLSTRAYLVVNREGRVQISDENRHVLARGKLSGNIERFRLRFKIESFGDDEHNGFMLDSLSVKRLATDPTQGSGVETKKP